MIDVETQEVWWQITSYPDHKQVIDLELFLAVVKTTGDLEEFDRAIQQKSRVVLMTVRDKREIETSISGMKIPKAKVVGFERR